MPRLRSPGYPSIPLGEAIDIVERLFSTNRQNPMDRGAAAKDMGYSALTGQSAKMLANLGHYGLLEKAGKGGVRVTDRAKAILYPRDNDEKRLALREAAFYPDLFAEIHENYPDGFVSENALRSYLMRNDYASVAIDPAIKSYLKTYDLLRLENATESHGATAGGAAESSQVKGDGPSEMQPAEVLRTQLPVPVAPAPKNDGVRMVDGERVVFVEETSPSQYLKVIASGELDSSLLEALEDYIKRQRKRLDVSKTSRDA